jgi:hypothetical protein
MFRTNLRIGVLRKVQVATFALDCYEFSPVLIRFTVFTSLQKHPFSQSNLVLAHFTTPGAKYAVQIAQQLQIAQHKWRRISV